MKKYTKEMENFIKKNAPGRWNKELVQLFNNHFNTDYSFHSIVIKKKQMKVKSNVDLKTSLANAGINTRFKKGNKPVNSHPIGAEVIREDGYVYVKVKETKPSRLGWIQKHRLLYEEHNGKIPAGHHLMFKDQNKLNISLENLLLVNMKEKVYMSKNRMFSSNPETNETGLLLTRLNLRVHRLETNNNAK